MTFNEAIEIVNEIDRLKAERGQLEKEKAELLDALSELYDNQNDAPLERHRARWAAAMEKARLAIKKAEKQYDKFAYIDATKTYERIAEKGYKSADMFQKLGNAYYFNADLAKAAKWYGELFAMNTEVSPEYYYRYSQALKSIGEYQKADQMMATFNQKVTDDSRGKRFSEKKYYLEVI